MDSEPVRRKFRRTLFRPPPAGFPMPESARQKQTIECINARGRLANEFGYSTVGNWGKRSRIIANCKLSGNRNLIDWALAFKEKLDGFPPPRSIKRIFRCSLSSSFANNLSALFRNYVDPRQ